MPIQLAPSGVHQNNTSALIKSGSLLIIDSQVENYQILAAGVTPDTEVYILQGDRDGISQIGEILQNRQNVAAVHIISHGKPGSVQLGNIWLNEANLETYALQLIQWRSSLSHNADILIYGCNVAAEINPNSQTAQQFLQQLHHLTGANIAASKTLTGNAALGGNWELEVKIGNISTPLAIAPSARLAYQGILPGDLVWAKGIGGSGNDDIGYSIAVDSSGNTYITGTFSGTVDFDPGAGTANLTSAGSNSPSLGEDIFIAKFDANGNYLWAKSIGGSGGDSGYSIAVDSSGNTYTTGEFRGTVDFDPGAETANLTAVGGNSNAFITKFDSNGNYLWAKNLGANSRSLGSGIAVDSSGNTYTTGFFSGTADFDPGSGTANVTSALLDIFITKFDPSGNYLWAKNIGGSGSNLGGKIAVDSTGNTYSIGRFSGTADFDPGSGTANLTSVNSEDIFIAKLDANGNYLWAKNIGSISGDGSISYNIAVDSSGNTYATGSFSGTADFDPGSGTANLTATGNGDIFIAKYDSNGNYLWAKNIGNSSSETSHSIAVDSSGNPYITGSFSGTVDFDLGAGTANLTSAGNTDIFIAKFDANGSYLWAKNLAGSSGINSGVGFGIAVDSSGNPYTTGAFRGTVDFDPGAGTTNLTSAGGSADTFTDIFIVKLGDIPTVSLSANTAPAEGGATGTFTLTLSSAAPAGGIAVAYTVGGSATSGTDYTTLPGTVTIPAGETTATINVVPTEDAAIEPGETVTLTLTDGAAYNLAASPNDTATLTIDDNDIEYAIVANNTSLTEGNTGTAPITYTITRTGRADVDSSVSLAFGGTATNSADYSLVSATGTGITNTGNTINFAAGATVATVTLNVVGDAIKETNEDIQVSLTPNTTPGGFQATVPVATPAATTIADDDTAGVTITLALSR